MKEAFIPIGQQHASEEGSGIILRRLDADGVLCKQQNLCINIYTADQDASEYLTRRKWRELVRKVDKLMGWRTRR